MPLTPRFNLALPVRFDLETHPIPLMPPPLFASARNRQRLNGGFLVMGEPPSVLSVALKVAGDCIIDDGKHPSCVFYSLAIRDFFHKIGIKAEVMPVSIVMMKWQDGEVVTSDTLGVPARITSEGKLVKSDVGEVNDVGWRGHLLSCYRN